MDISSESIQGVLPIYLITSLGASASTLGLFEGITEAIALVVKVFSGSLSDWMKRRKPLVVLGYSMGAISKPLFALASTVSMFFFIRIFDRIGKGIRGAPRDALMADIVPENLRGQAFGLRQSLDTIGAFVGPILAILVLSLSNNNFSLLFWIAAIPGILAVSVLVLGVNEIERSSNEKTKGQISFSDIKRFKNDYWLVVLLGCIFQLSRFSEAFLVLKGKEIGLPIESTPFVFIVMNIVYALTAYPVGHLSDRMGRSFFLIMGFFVLILAHLILATTSNIYITFLGIGLWGLHMGFSQGVLSAMIADTCPPEFKGTAFGVFNLFSAFALLLASSLAGILWDSFGGEVTFLSGAAFAAVSLVLFIFTKKV
jgi:MFS family permease